jgi:ring-1,2-phenylacetyl-CoA epoxidase subunit PaaD
VVTDRPSDGLTGGRAGGPAGSALPATSKAVLEVLQAVKDPEVPVLSVVELGVVRGAEVEGNRVTITITPTYSGCPALQVMEQEITAALENAGFEEVAVKTVYSPAWTTDWIPESAREKLRAYGIAPPGAAGGTELVTLGPTVRTATCPFCGSSNTARKSEFGSTACKSLHVCHSCRQPFEHFKAF